MTIQTTFRSVAKPRVAIVSAALVGGQLHLNGATGIIFAGAAVGTVTSLLGHEYLVDGQELYLVNSHPTNSLTITIGAFSKVIPAGYSAMVAFDQANASFYSHFKHADLKPIEDNVAANASAISAEASARAADTALLYKLDGTRALTGNMDLAGFYINGAPAAVNGDQPVNKSQFDSTIATLNSAISASSTSLAWRSPAQFITEFVTGTIPANGDALVDSNFGAGIVRLFEDDETTTNYSTVANIAVDSEVVFLKAGSEPKRMVVRDVLGTKRWYDETEVNANLKLARQIVAGDTFIVEVDLLAPVDAQETQAIYHISPGTPKTAVKLGDLDWKAASGISIDATYTRGAGGATVISSDTVLMAIQKLDGNIEKDKVDAAAALSSAISTEVTDRNSAIATAIATEVGDRDSAISTSQAAQDAKLASVAVNEGASLIGINDVDALYTATTVEGSLREVRQHVNTAETEIVALQTDVANHTTQISQHTADISSVNAALVQYEADVASVAVSKGASLVGLHDSVSGFTATNVEDALAELNNKVNTLNLVTLKRGLNEVATSGATSLNLATNFVDQLVGGVVQDLSGATYINASVNRDGAMLIGGVGYTISGATITFTTAGGGALIAGEVIEIKIIEIN